MNPNPLPMKTFLALCLAALLGYAAAAQPLRTLERLDLPIEQGLRLALNQQLPVRDVPHALNVLHYVLWAGYRGSPSDRATLREIVEGYEEGRLPEAYARVALSSLEFLGEDEDYFLDLARRWNTGEGAERERRRWISYYAMMVLARKPTPEVLAVLDSVKVVSHDDDGSIPETAVRYAQNPYNIARNIPVNVEQYESLPSAHERIQMAVNWTARGWAWGGGLLGFEENLSPQAVVGQRWLAELSRQYPQQVAQAIATRPFDPEHPLADKIGEIRAYIASFASEDVRALVADLTRGD